MLDGKHGLATVRAMHKHILTDTDADDLSAGPGLILVRDAESDLPADERRGAWPVARPLVEPGQGRSRLDAADKAGALDWIALGGALIIAAALADQHITRDEARAILAGLPDLQMRLAQLSADCTRLLREP